MKALVLEGVGHPLKLQDVADPAPGAGEAVVALEAAALNHRDLWIQKGQYAGLEFPIILGSDGCGAVAAVGEGVDSSWIGRRVIFNPSIAWGARTDAQATDFRILGLPDNGTFAERVVIPASQLVAAPGHLDAVHAAALPLTGLTAFRALFSAPACRRANGCWSRVWAAAGLWRRCNLPRRPARRYGSRAGQTPRSRGRSNLARPAALTTVSRNGRKRSSGMRAAAGST